jgi:hypothetical protein
MIVRPVEYIIGRLDGRFAPPNDSLSYRRNNKKRKQKDDNNLFSSVRSHENYNIMIILLEMIVLTKHLEPV